MMDHLYTPWRMAYIRGEKKPVDGCVFCALAAAPDDNNQVIAYSEYVYVTLNKYPYNNGHLLVAPKRHEKQLCGLPVNEYDDINEALRRAVAIVGKIFNPGGINLGMNLGKCAGAGVEDHMHWHIVPRWEGDTNFMPVLSETRVIPQHLLDCYDRLKPYFENFME